MSVCERSFMRIQLKRITKLKTGLKFRCTLFYKKFITVKNLSKNEMTVFEAKGSKNEN